MDLTLFEALTGGAFDRLNWQYSGEFDQNFSKKSNARGFARGGMGGFGIDWRIMNRTHNPRMTFEIKIQRQLNTWLWSVTITQILQTINGIL